MENQLTNHQELESDSLVLEVKQILTVHPKFTREKWASGEGGGQDQGESPTDTVTS